ncbi:DUF4149 domain-containing protein [Hylemonella gracilis]|uniref:DUF4149 domain-containing protein n=1 Tax=Hylemonella gracilis TaxID=80880 RepID=A0A4P6UJE4_9BURK|nr:DUF4149 domain-containing protein [Hylemonella gracilis]QBK05153.1 DUF4149 domain-containing protein [Hylemonella gracilis]
MQRLLSSLPAWAAALWWGSLTTIGFLVVPLLFVHLETPAIAGRMAAHLFTAQTWVSVACTLLLLLASRPRRDDGASAPQSLVDSARLPVLAGLMLALLVEIVVAPRIVARENLVLWHRLGSAFYFLQWLCAGWTFWRLSQTAASHRD